MDLACACLASGTDAKRMQTRHQSSALQTAASLRVPGRPGQTCCPSSSSSAGVHPHPNGCGSFGFTREKPWIPLYTL